MFESSPTILSNGLAASSVMSSVLPIALICAARGAVAPLTAASVACFSCSGVRPKLHVLLLTSRPPAKEHGPIAEALSAVAAFGHATISPATRLAVIPAMRIPVITGACPRPALKAPIPRPVSAARQPQAYCQRHPDHQPARLDRPLQSCRPTHSHQ